MSTPKIEVTVCCGADLKYLNDDLNDSYVCARCKKSCEVEEVCEYCLGSGEISVDEQVYSNEPHCAPIGTRKCICQIVDEEDDTLDEESSLIN